MGGARGSVLDRLTDRLFLDFDRVFEVETEADLIDLTNTFLTKPLFTKVYLAHQQNTSHHGGRVDVMEINRWIGAFD